MNSNSLMFSKDHLWVSVNNGEAKIGLSQYAVEKMKSILFVNLPDINEKVEIGKSFGDVESLKTVSDLISPVTGMVIDINTEILDDCECIIDETCDNWLITVQCEKISETLLSEADYMEFNRNGKQNEI